MDLPGFEGQRSDAPVRGDIDVVALTRRWQHHTKSGGYSRLVMAVGAEEGKGFQCRQSFWYPVARLWWKMCKRSRGYRHTYKYEDWLAERDLLAKVSQRRPELVHVLYGDWGLDLLLRRRPQLPCPLMATFHLPGVHAISGRNHFQPQLTSGLDAAVVMSRYQLQDYQRWLGVDRVFYVPHGIDTECFTPGGSAPQQPGLKLITVGQFMRDFRALGAIIDECNARELPVQFDLVVTKNRWPSFTGRRNVRLQTGIEDHELIQMYREADALLIPMLDATANNAVQESLACGTPVISNRVGGVTDYVDDECGWLFDRGEVTGIVELIAAMCRRREIAASRRAAARRKALEFDWSSVAGQMREIYRIVAAKSPTVGDCGANTEAKVL